MTEQPPEALILENVGPDEKAEPIMKLRTFEDLKRILMTDTDDKMSLNEAFIHIINKLEDVEKKVIA